MECTCHAAIVAHGGAAGQHTLESRKTLQLSGFEYNYTFFIANKSSVFLFQGLSRPLVEAPLFFHKMSHVTKTPNKIMCASSFKRYDKNG